MANESKSADDEHGPPTSGAWPAAKDLPDPRPDGVCAVCEKKAAVTRDGRFCRPCLKKMLNRLTPGDVRRGGAPRSMWQREDRWHDSGPWGENNVRILEGD